MGCGCSGSWYIGFAYSNNPGVIYYFTQSGIEFDNPYLRDNPNGSRDLISACDGRNFLGRPWETYQDGAFLTSKVFTKSDPNCSSGNNPDTGYDCINGVCVLATVYNTPGQYASLSACQSACGVAPCDGVCLSNSEYDQIKNALLDSKAEVCG